MSKKNKRRNQQRKNNQNQNNSGQITSMEHQDGYSFRNNNFNFQISDYSSHKPQPPVDVNGIMTLFDVYSQRTFAPTRPSEEVLKLKNNNIFEPITHFNKKVSLFHGDITTLKVDAIVNAANESLQSGGGIDAAIHKAAGFRLQVECDAIGGCPTGEARITKGYKLPAEYIIHTVGPRGEVPSQLQHAYANSFRCAIQNNVRTLAFPCISTGVYGYPSKKAITVALETTRFMLEANSNYFDRVIFVTYEESDKRLYEQYSLLYFPPQ